MFTSPLSKLFWNSSARRHWPTNYFPQDSLRFFFFDGTEGSLLRICVLWSPWFVRSIKWPQKALGIKTRMSHSATRETCRDRRQSVSQWLSHHNATTSGEDNDVCITGPVVNNHWWHVIRSLGRQETTNDSRMYLSCAEPVIGSVVQSAH